MISTLVKLQQMLEGYFLQNRIIFDLCGQAFASFQHGLFMSEEMLDTIILYTLKVYQKNSISKRAQ